MAIVRIGIAASLLASSVNFNPISRNAMFPFVTVVLLGLFLGMRHSTDPDHVVAVSTIVSRQRSIVHSTVIGMMWGLGHSLTIFIVGSAIIIFGVIIPPRLGLSMEFSVALMLILLGVLNLTGVMRWITERFTPSHKEGHVHGRHSSATHLPGEPKPEHLGKERSFWTRMVENLGLYQALRPFAVGLVHGLAGSAAVALLVLSTIKSPLWATAYLLVFGAGTMIGMMIMTTAIAMPLAYSSKRFLKVNQFMTTTSGLLSMAFGLFLVYHIGLVDGLFTGRPHWIPQ
ncbi:MAG: high-affinity nickel-transport family protein [Terriglobales bacterium]